MRLDRLDLNLVKVKTLFASYFMICVMLIYSSDDACAQRRFCSQFSEPSTSDGELLWVAHVCVVHAVLVCHILSSRVGAYRIIC